MDRGNRQEAGRQVELVDRLRDKQTKAIDRPAARVKEGRLSSFCRIAQNMEKLGIRHIGRPLSMCFCISLQPVARMHRPGAGAELGLSVA